MTAVYEIAPSPGYHLQRGTEGAQGNGPWSIPTPPASEGMLERIADVLFPRNVVTGKRQLRMIPMCIETFLVRQLFALKHWSKVRSVKLSPGVGRTYQEVADGVLRKLLQAMPEFYPKQYSFRVHVMSSEMHNAYAYPDGNIVIGEQLIETISSALELEQFRECVSSDGTRVVDLSRLTQEDAIAFILGHEMTHVYRRDSAFALTMGCCTQALVFGCSRLTRHLGLQFMTGHIRGLEGRGKSTMSEIYRIVSLVERAMTAAMLALRAVLSWTEFMFSRQKELQCDQRGTSYAANAHFDPRGAVLCCEIERQMQVVSPSFLTRILGHFSTHPSYAARVDALINEISHQDYVLVLPRSV